jgi:hypothetical protein
MNLLTFTEALRYKEQGTLIQVTNSNALGDTIVLSVIQDEGMALLALSPLGEVLGGKELGTGDELQEAIDMYLSSGWSLCDSYHEKMADFCKV